jgi:XTP/dITP diphosphohydrolase
VSEASGAGHVLAIASNNQGKIAELRSLLGNAVNVVTLADLGLESPEETGRTFLENAELKARYVFERTGLPALADDSGLEVDALNGRPGVRSARYAGETATDADNRALLLVELRDIPARKRTARFISVICLVDASGQLHVAEGACEGVISIHERGVNGFGYDSLFQLDDGQTMAELDPGEKNRRSHRALAMRRALPALHAALGLASTHRDVEAP